MRRIAPALLGAVLTLAACGGGGTRQLAGYAVEPVPVVGVVTLPDLTDGGSEFPFRAQPGGLLLVYFGYTNCPDACPTTLTNVKFARQALDDPARIEMAMVSIDPARDLDNLADYVTSVMPDYHGLGTDDDDVLRKAADAFGATYDVTEVPDGEPAVAHTTLLYAVDDDGHVVLAWPYGVTIDDLQADLEQLLDDA